MPAAFLLESFEKHKAKGIARFRMGELEEAKYHFLKAAEYLLRLARGTEGPLREVRLRKARELVDLARNVRGRKEAARTKAAAKPAGTPAETAPGDRSPTERPKVRFDDIAGLEDVKEQIRLRMILPFSHPEKARRYKVRPGGGILLYGPPGTGKTLIAKAVAGEIEAAFFAIAPSEILNKWVGESEKNIRRLFETARESERAVVFIDEVEALVPRRRDTEQGSVMARVVPQILAELDGFDSGEERRLLFMGATNEPWNIDSAMLRPGRLDEKVYVGLPDPAARRRILELNLKDIPLAGDVDLDALAERLGGYSGADTAYLCRKTSEQVFLRAVGKGEERPLAGPDFERVLETLRPSVAPDDVARFKRFKAGR
jgi:transitional endoplasmic reticulum ATPase